MSDWKFRLTERLEPLLKKDDPRPDISAYHDMPYAIFRYLPQDEFELRHALELLCTRLGAAGKRVTRISLVACMLEALEAEGFSGETLESAEVDVGVVPTIETIHQILSEYQPLDELVAARFPSDADPCRDVVFLERAGGLYPVYRTSSLLDQLKDRVDVPAVLFYPGTLSGAAGLKFMGILDAEHNYRPKIF